MLRLEDTAINAGGFALRGVSFETPAGSYAVLMGKTGSGKTTLLEAIAGLRPVVGGTITLGGRDLTRLPASQRRIGYVPQDGAVFGAMTVRENLAFPLLIRRRGQSAIAEQAERLAERLALTALLDQSARTLSGGETQRVALGRALAAEPELLLLDEPLSALDEATRGDMIALLKTVQAETGVTTLHVTHSRAEATRLANTLLELAEGQVHQRQPAPRRAAAGDLAPAEAAP